MPLPGTRTVCLIAVLAAGVALGVALAAERFGGLVPCALCLVERWPYRIAIALGIVAGLLPRRAARVLLLLLAMVVLADAGLGLVHVGVEQHVWPSPLPECAAPRIAAGSIAERLAAMPAHPAKPCDDPTYPVPGLPLSMAAMNLIYALVFSIGLATYLWRSRGAAT